jgi:hypothetical protein
MSILMTMLVHGIQACNICGCDGCGMANPRHMVTFTNIEGLKKKMSCGDLQDKANARGGFTEEFCQTELVSKAWDQCSCYNKLGQPLTDYYAGTVPPAAVVPSAAPINEIGTWSLCIFSLRLPSLSSSLLSAGAAMG